MPTAPDRIVHVEHVMGTAASFDIRDPTTTTAVAIAEACDWLHDVDRIYSPYRSDSVISRLDRGEIPPGDVDLEVDVVLHACALLQTQSGGAFDARATGRLDPSAYVKGWAAERAAEILLGYGLRHFQINAGGDIVVRGDADRSGGGWRIGIRHPSQPAAVAAIACLHDQAIATSARYERGDHIIDPATGRAVNATISVTVVAAHLGHADGWSTALFAAGARREELAAAREDVDVLFIDGGLVTSSERFPLCSDELS